MDIHQKINASIFEQDQLVDYTEEIQLALKLNPRTIVVLDDDPTGTQTMFNVPVITSWAEDVIENEFKNNTSLFFILTNSRSLQEQEAVDLAITIGKNLRKVAEKYHRELIVISRGDSTLRGHYPAEVDGLGKGLGINEGNHILAPAFFEGGRYTFNDIHYVKEGENYIPAAETPFANDNTFGYNSSDLKLWVEEKTNGKVKASNVESFKLETIRNGLEAVQHVLETSIKKYFIVNATTYTDLQVVALACLKSKKHLLFRTSASFVNAISGISPREILTKEELLLHNNSNGALVIIGSYVPKTSAQLSYLKRYSEFEFIEINASEFIEDIDFTGKIQQLSSTIDQKIANQKTVIVYTSRNVISGNSKEESLRIVNKISTAIVDIVKNLTKKPKYLIAKGGITSSDIAVKGLNVNRANVIGQAIKGVPVWELSSDSKFPGMPYIVFPGNVGDETSIYTILNNLK